MPAGNAGNAKRAPGVRLAGRPMVASSVENAAVCTGDHKLDKVGIYGGEVGKTRGYSSLLINFRIELYWDYGKGRFVLWSFRNFGKYILYGGLFLMKKLIGFLACLNGSLYHSFLNYIA